MLPPSIWLMCLAAIGVAAQDDNSVVVLSQPQSTDASTTGTASTTSGTSSGASSGTSSGTQSSSSAGRRTGGEAYSAISFTQTVETVATTVPYQFTGSEYTYLSYNGQSTVTETTDQGRNRSATLTSNSQITRSADTQSVIGLTRTANATMTSTSTGSHFPMNTQPCNNYVEFCDRKYSNITEVCAHNSAFSIPNNAASNQALSITQQLNDGVRMLQGETWRVNGTIYNCHSSCDLLNAGSFQSELEEVVRWLEDNPFEILTFLIGNSQRIWVENYTIPIENSGIKPYIYLPEYVPQHKDQWPTLGEMILSGKRVVMFMDYFSNQESVPYILDEFTHIWETPFSPQNDSFPCTQQRPPGLNETVAREQYMYIANHNLNVAVDFGSLAGGMGDGPLLIPNSADINNTNGQFDTHGQLQEMAMDCMDMWGSPPNWLLVDYYNYGDPGPGSVFEVAARMNNVTYNRPCCGEKASPAPAVKASFLALVAAAGFAVLLSM